MKKETESLILKVSDAGRLLGEIVSIEEISSELMKKAESYFRKGDDSLANVFRRESISLSEKAETRRRIYDSTVRKEESEAWEILSRTIK